MAGGIRRWRPLGGPWRAGTPGIPAPAHGCGPVADAGRLCGPGGPAVRSAVSGRPPGVVVFLVPVPAGRHGRAPARDRAHRGGAAEAARLEHHRGGPRVGTRVAAVRLRGERPVSGRPRPALEGAGGAGPRAGRVEGAVQHQRPRSRGEGAPRVAGPRPGRRPPVDGPVVLGAARRGARPGPHAPRCPGVAAREDQEPGRTGHRLLQGRLHRLRHGPESTGSARPAGGVRRRHGGGPHRGPDHPRGAARRAPAELRRSAAAGNRPVAPDLRVQRHRQHRLHQLGVPPRQLPEPRHPAVHRTAGGGSSRPHASAWACPGRWKRRGYGPPWHSFPAGRSTSRTRSPRCPKTAGGCSPPRCPRSASRRPPWTSSTLSRVPALQLHEADERDGSVRAAPGSIRPGRCGAST